MARTDPVLCSNPVMTSGDSGASFVRALLSAIGRARDDVLLAVCRLYFAPCGAQAVVVAGDGHGLIIDHSLVPLSTDYC